MNLDATTIYREHPDKYHALVMAEDCDRQLISAIEARHELDGAQVLEVGAGTGRITAQLLERGAQVEAFEKEEAMLKVADRYLAGFESVRYELRQADARSLPVADNWADVAIAGWVFGHFRYWLPDDWRQEIGAAIEELDRALVDGGVGIIIETLGTGEEKPAPPEGLREYYDWLENERGCTPEVIRSDYLFDDVATAAETMGFFFGAAIEERVHAEGSSRIPEVTGLWWWRRGR